MSRLFRSLLPILAFSAATAGLAAVFSATNLSAAGHQTSLDARDTLTRSGTRAKVVSWLTDYGKAQKLHRQRQSLMLVVLTMDGCPYCHKMFSETYGDASVVREIKDSFVPTVVNADTQPRLAQAFGARVFPTTYLVGPDNKIVDRIDGYVDADQLRRRMSQAVRRYAKVARVPESG